MALPVYQRRGIMYADLPRVETANLKEGARTFETIDRKLDQLSAFVEREGTAQAKEAAFKYAAQNPVTQEQIDQAMSSQGEAKSWLSALTGGNVYNETLQAAQGSFLANKLEIEATTRLNQLKVLAESGQVNLEDAQVEIQDMIDGYTATISAFNPEAGLKSRAAMAADGNRIIDGIATLQASKIMAANKAAFEDGLNQKQRAIEDEYFHGDTFDPTTGTFVSAESRVDIGINTMLMNAVTSNNGDRVPEIYEMRREARINGLTKGVLNPEFASSPIAVEQMFKSGKMGKYQSLWDQMPDDERAEVIKGYRDELVASERIAKAKREQEQTQLLDRAYDIRNLILEVPDEEVDALIEEAEDINVALRKKEFTRKELTNWKERKFREVETDPDLLNDLEYRINWKFENNDPIDREYLKKLNQDEQLSDDDFRSLQNLLRSRMDKNYTAEIKTLKSVVKSNVSAFQKSSVTTKKQNEAIVKFSQKIDQGIPAPEARKQVEEEIKESSRKTEYDAIVDGIKREINSRSGEYYDIYVGVEEAKEAPAETVKREGVTDDTGVLRKFGAPGLGLGKEIPQAGNIYGIGSKEVAIKQASIDALIKAMVETPELIDEWVVDAEMNKMIKEELAKLKELEQ